MESPMCGIAGFSLNPNDPSITNSRKLAGRMLLDIQSRGRDATGAAWYDPQGMVSVQKSPVMASAFVRNLSMWRKATTAVMHTRAWTQGTPADPNNNHPIQTGGITGVHNGCLHNDWELFKYDIPKAPRFGEVDSEAAFAVLAWGASEGHKLDTLRSQLEAIEGTAALAWLDDQDEKPALHLARVYASPLVVAANEYGSVFFASTYSAIVDAIKGLDCNLIWDWDLEEGQYIKVVDGFIEDSKRFAPAGATYRSWGSRSATKKAAGQNVTVTTTSPVYTAADSVDEFMREWRQANDEALASHEPVNDKYTTVCDIESRLLNIEETVEYDPADFQFDYRVRLKAINAFANKHGELTALTNGMNLRPGDWVQTEFSDDWYWAQLIAVPDTFPGGKYTLRVMLTRKGFAADVAIIHRGIDDLQWPVEIDKRFMPFSLDLEDITGDDDELGDRVHRALMVAADGTVDLDDENDSDEVAELYVPF